MGHLQHGHIRMKQAFLPGKTRPVIPSVQHCHMPGASNDGVMCVKSKSEVGFRGVGKVIKNYFHGEYLPHGLAAESIQHRNGTELDFHFCFAVHL